MNYYIGGNTLLSSLILQKDPKWRLPSAQFNIVFTCDLAEVLRYGPNGLHYLEHILFNIINGGGDYFQGNASTFDNGVMHIFLHSTEENLEENMIAFYRSLTDTLNPKKHVGYSKYFSTERRRVTTEVSKIHDDGEMTLMFVSNPDLYRGEYSSTYIWNILFRCCRLEKIGIICHCDVKDKTVKKFEQLSSDFDEAWKKANDIILPVVPVPSVGIFPPSSFPAFSLKEPTVVYTVSLRSIDNPILRALVARELSKEEQHSPFLFEVATYGFKKDSPKEGPPKEGSPKEGSPKEKDLPPTIPVPRPSDPQYFWAPMLMSSSIVGKKTPEWLSDLTTLTEGEMMKKYGKEAKKIAKELS
jgi:hypothetical protein